MVVVVLLMTMMTIAPPSFQGRLSLDLVVLCEARAAMPAGQSAHMDEARAERRFPLQGGRSVSPQLLRGGHAARSPRAARGGPGQESTADGTCDMLLLLGSRDRPDCGKPQGLLRCTEGERGSSHGKLGRALQWQSVSAQHHVNSLRKHTQELGP